LVTKTQEIKNIAVEKNGEVNLGVIKLSTGAKILKEVVVEGQKDLIEERVDRTIYNAENDQTARGGDATDVLKRVPMLSVDLDGNVSLRGSSNVTVLINNKPSTIMASSIADALKQIPADQIKSVEVITSPSAKYDAEGTGGIINIITKKNTLQGATLNIDAGVGLRGSNLGLNGNYRTGKMGFSLGGFGRSMYNVTGSFENSQLTKDLETNNEYLNLQRADTRQRGLFGNYTLGWDYDIDKKNTLAASVRFGARNNKNFQDGLLTEFYTNDVFSSSTLRNSTTNDLNNTVDVNLTYTHLYEKPQKEFSLMALYSKNNRNNDFNNLTLEEDGTSVNSGYINLNDSYNQEITLQADFQTPIDKNQMLELGGKDIMRKAFSDFTYLQDMDGDGIYEVSDAPLLTNNLNYDQNIVAGYLSYTLSFGKGYSFKAGSRYEYTTIEAYTKTEENIDIPAYGVFVPSVNISKKLKAGTIKLAYNRRIQRPSIQFLNPTFRARIK
jgi:outer membrane receptor protein involved in Fe transport